MKRLVWLPVLAGLFACLAAVSPASASVFLAGHEEPAFRPAVELIGMTLPSQPTEPGRWRAQVQPAYLTYKKSQSLPDGGQGAFDHDLSGAGLAAEVGYTFAAGGGRFGAQAAAGAFRLDGRRLGFSAGGSPTQLVYGAERAQGAFGEVAALFDPFGGGHGFRLPLMLGVWYLSAAARGTAEAPVSAGQAAPEAAGTYRASRDQSMHVFGVCAGVSPQVPLGENWRVSPFFIVLLPLKNTEGHAEQRNESAGGATIMQESYKDTGIAVGISGGYRPWGLSVAAVPSFSGAGAGAFSLIAAKTF